MDDVARLRARVEELESRLHRFAHDSNNLLTCILGHASVLEATADPASEVRETAIVIGKAAERAAELTRQLRQADTGGGWLPVDVHQAIREVGELLRGAVSGPIRIAYELAADQALIVGDPGQIHQMLLNLAMNAAEAMPEGGDLTFGTCAGPGDAELAIEVRDTGRGVPPDLRERIFEASFSTKAGGAAGMGLAIVRAIVDAHGGRIEVAGEQGGGTTVRLRLPRQAPKAAGA